MRFENRKYVIIILSNYDEEALEKVCIAGNSTYLTIRKSMDGTKAILKWDGDTPSVFDGMTTYSHSEILTELKKSDWTDDA